MKRIDNQLFTIMAALILVMGCQKESSKTKEQVMQERLTERLDRWKGDMDKKCRKDVEEKATALTDSIIIANAKQNRDTSILSILPGRPTRPDYKPPTDSVAVKPILKKD
jgi:cell division protein ZapA (FtsZ GTPase activity inhibitor)